MKNASLLKIITLMVIAVALVGAALALTAPRNKPAIFSDTTLHTNLDTASAGSSAAPNGKDWGAVIGKLDLSALLKQNHNAAKSLNSSEMKAVQDVLGQTNNEQPAAGSISRDADGSLSSAGQMAQKAFDQMGNKLFLGDEDRASKIERRAHPGAPLLNQ
jgi:hypothetical protein